MPRLFERQDDRKKMMNSLIVLRSKLQKQSPKPQEIQPEGLGLIEQKMDDILIKLKGLERKVENVRRERITDFIDSEKMAKGGEAPKEGARKLKVKGIIRSLLEQHGKLTSYDLSRMLKLSRTRCSEYLKDFERNGVVEGETVRRKRFYSLVSN
jgi:Fic family protein